MQTAAEPEHLAKIVRREPTHIRFCNTPSVGAGVVWLNPSRSSHNLVWCHPRPADIILELFLSANLKGTLKNSNLELDVLVLHEATLLAAVPAAHMAMQCPGSDNIPTVFRSTREASTINLVVSDLHRIHALHSIHFFFKPLVFTTQGKKIASWMMPLASLVYLTPPFFSTCLSRNHSLSVHGSPPP